MNTFKSTLCTSMLALVFIPSAFADDMGHARYVVFDVPGGGQVVPTAINAGGDITGTYADPNTGNQAFLRSADGTLTTFTVPGTSLPTPVGISSDGTVAGRDESGDNDGGFVRHTDGSLSTPTVPKSLGTVPLSMNALGDITGYFYPLIRGENSYPTVFVMTAAGAFTTFGIPGVTNDSISGEAINNLDDVAGIADVDGFVQTHAGVYTRFTVPGSSPGLIETTPTGINDAGTVAGYAFNSVCGGAEGETCVMLDQRSFVRMADGTIDVFYVSGVQGNAKTFAQGINAAGTVAGYYRDGIASHGFIRDSGGATVRFDVPGMSSTFAGAINDRGVVTGSCFDSAHLQHGFVRFP